MRHESHIIKLPRGRAQILAVGASVLALGAAIYSHAESDGPGANSTPITARPHREVTIMPGDTVWRIAEEAYPGENHDVRAIVDAIEGLQPADVDPGELQPGQKVYLEPDAQIGQLVEPGNTEVNLPPSVNKG